MHGEVVLGLWRADERRIDPAVAQGAEKVRAHECPDFDADGGVLLPEPLNQPGDGPELDQWLPPNHQVPRLVACDLSDRFDACIETREYLAGTVEKVGPDGGELDTAARTLEQRDLELAVERHDRQQSGQVDQRCRQQPPGSGSRPIVDESGRNPQKPERKYGGEHEVDTPGQPDQGRQHADRQQRQAVVERLKARAAAAFVEHRQESHARTGVVLAVEVADRERMRDLPEEHYACEHPGLRPQLTIGCGPARYRRQRTRDGTRDHRERRDGLERRVDEQIDDGDRSGDLGGERVGRESQDGNASGQERGSEGKGLGREEAAFRKRAVPRARHAGVEVALHPLIQGERPGRRECRAYEEPTERQKCRRSGRAEDVSDRGGDEHHEHDPGLGERQVVPQAAAHQPTVPADGRGHHGNGCLPGPAVARATRRQPTKRLARSVRARLVASSAAPTTRWLVVAGTARRLQMVTPPSVIWSTNRRRKVAAAVRTANRCTPRTAFTARVPSWSAVTTSASSRARVESNSAGGR